MPESDNEAQGLTRRKLAQPDPDSAGKPPAPATPIDWPMPPVHRPPWQHLLLAGILIGAFVWQSLSASMLKSPVFDEPGDIASGLSYIETGLIRANLQHPPLLKEMGGVCLRLAGVRWPHSPMAEALTRGDSVGAHPEWELGNGIIHDNGADRVLFWARLPFLLLAALLGILIYWWGRELVGETAALGALFLFSLDPNILAHAALATTDVGLAAFTMLFLFTVWRYAQRPDWKRMLACGVALGAVLCAKFSAVFLLPVAAVLLWAAARGNRETNPKAGPNTPCPCGSGKKYKKCHGAEGAAPGPEPRRLLPLAGAFLGMCVVAAVVVETLYLFPSDPFLYVTGLKSVNADHVSNFFAFLHGDLDKRFYSYFVAVWLLKEPMATVLLTAAGLALLVRRKSKPVTTKLFLLLPPAVLLAAMTLLADDIGVRYIIPAMPFAYLLGGLGLAALCEKGMAWGRYVAAGLCVWVVVAAAGIYPDHLSYFNEAACMLEQPELIGWDGGSRCGTLWLDDSNVDWGQGLKQLRSWMDLHGNGRALRLGYFGIYPPEDYGLRCRKLELRDLLPEPTPGLYAVSAHLVAGVPALGEQAGTGAGWWLRRTAPTDIVGHAFYIYDVK